MQKSQPWWEVDIQEVCSRLGTDGQRGLGSEEAKQRLQEKGPNQLPEAKAVPPLKLFIGQFNSFIVWVLLGAALVAGILKEWLDSIAILVIVILNSILGFIQEYRAERSLAALKKLTVPTSHVIRNGHVEAIPAREIVPGDLIALEAGDRVPADGRVIQAFALRSQEAALTGESMPVEKNAEGLSGEHIGIGDRHNMVYMGTVIVGGKGKVIVTETGLGTELGKIAALLERAEEEKTPLQIRLDQLGHRLVMFFLLVVTLVFAAGLVRGHSLMEMLLIALSLAVAAIPEGLPAVVTISLAFGVRKMAKRNALIRRLPSVETLGCATVVCSDKTGTLTQNEMTVRKIWADEKMIELTGSGYSPEGQFFEDGRDIQPGQRPELLEVMKISMLCNNAELKKTPAGWEVLGDPTEGALLSAAMKAGLSKENMESQNPVLSEIPFDSERKRMSIVRKTAEGPVLFVKGAPDIILGLSEKYLRDGKVLDLGTEDRKRIEKVNQDLAGQAYRVLASAYRALPGAGEPASMETGLIFAGLVAMMDPPRPEAKKAIEKCRGAGIRSVMITGDHKNTAVAIAKELALSEAGSLALSGAELDALGDEELAGEIEKVSVYARVSAAHKLKIIRAWKKRGAIVAMTGDGVNDAPAIKEADIGIAMGLTGTDVTKEASDMVITDDNFASIVNAVEEGRGIYENIVKFVLYLLASNVAEILVLFIAMMAGLRDVDGRVVIPLTAVQILWMNLVTDGLPAVALGVDPVSVDAMKKPPRNPKEAIFSRLLTFRLVYLSFLITAGGLMSYWISLHANSSAVQTMTLTTLVVLQLVKVQVIRAIYRTGLFSNPWLTLALVSSFFLQMMIIYIPFFRGIFETVPLAVWEWGIILLIASVVGSLGIVINKMLERVWRLS